MAVGQMAGKNSWRGSEASLEEGQEGEEGKGLITRGQGTKRSKPHRVPAFLTPPCHTHLLRNIERSNILERGFRQPAVDSDLQEQGAPP